MITELSKLKLDMPDGYNIDEKKLTPKMIKYLLFYDYVKRNWNNPKLDTFEKIYSAYINSSATKYK